MEYANHLKEYAPAWSASQVDEEVARIRKAAEARNHNTEVYKFCYSAIDLTTLSCNDSVKSVTEFARKAAEFYQKYPHIPNVASICIYPSFVETVGLAVDGTPMKIIATCMDSGGHFPDEVLRFCKDRWHRRIFAIKGRGGTDVPYLKNPTKNNRVKAPLFTIGVDTGKGVLYQRLKVKMPGPNYCHFPQGEAAGYDYNYFRGLTAEKMVVRYRKGRAVIAWELKGDYKRNEPLDLRNYATAALEITNPVLESSPVAGEAQRTVRRTGRRQVSGGI